MFFFKKTCKAKFIAYFSKISKYRALIQLFQSKVEYKKVLLIYFFEESCKEMNALLEGTSIKSQIVTANSLLGDGFNLINARDLKNMRMPKADLVLGIEVHPIHSINQIALEAALKSEMSTLTFYTGLDEVVMKAFGSERIMELMKKLGMDENESIEHAMIDKSIVKGQKKLESSLSIHKDISGSQDEWIASNQIASN